ncbi:MAG: hypothetical protein HRT68_14830 [Flavobacteriaceae bacterium]|nr:hypothetical protein [Flavobacteriaceae bacterium]
MNKICLALATLAVIACKNDVQKEPRPIDYAVFSGTITNGEDEVLKIRGGNGFEHEIEIDEAGKFADTIQLENGYYTFSIGRERSSLYLSQGDNLQLTMNTEEFDESIKYTGDGSVENNYLAQKAMMYETMNGKTEELYALAPEAFDQKTSQTKEAVTKALESLKEVDPNFVEGQKEDINYSYLNGLMNYPGWHEYFAKPETFTELPENF